jgi:hypothetical protein
MNVIRPSPGRNIEAASTVTTWPSFIAQVKGAWDLRKVKDSAKLNERQKRRVDERAKGWEVKAESLRY